MLKRGFRRIVWLLKPTTPSAGAGAAAQVPTQRLSLGMTITTQFRYLKLIRSVRLSVEALSFKASFAAFSLC